VEHPVEILACGTGAGDGVRHADFHQRAAATLGFSLRKGTLSRPEEGMHAGCRLLGSPAQIVIEGHLQTTFLLAIEECTGGNGHLQHLLQAQRLRTELDPI
jgi:hypothetical protein